MADISDVEVALVAAIAAAIYPTGTTNPSVVGAPVKVYRGWPNAAALDTDLLAGTVNISVFSMHGFTRNTTRGGNPLFYGPTVAPTMTATVNTALTQVTIGGTGGVKQNVGLETSAGPYAVQAQAVDTPGTVAAALAAIVLGATVAGTVITGPYDPKLIARTGGMGTVIQELRRQQQGFQVTVWAPTQPLRDTTASATDAGLAQIQFLTLADGTAGHLTYRSTVENDVPTKDRLWRRDLHYLVEYGTVVSKTAAQILFGTDAITAAGATRTSYV